MLSSILLYQTFMIFIIFEINKSFSIGTYYTTNTTKYYIDGDQTHTWYDGLNECLKLNMTLVSIETKAKSEEINALVNKVYGKNLILWVGGILIPSGSSRYYVWLTTGHTFSYTNWKLNNPDFSLNNEYCIQIGVNANMEWNDNVCENKYGFICEELQIHKNAGIDNEKYHKTLQQHQQLIKDHDELKINFSRQIIEEQNLKKELEKQINLVENLKKELQQMKTKHNEVINEIEKNENLQIKLNEKLENLLQILQKQQTWQQQQIEEKLLGKENEKSVQVEGKNKKYHDLLFQANQNAYFFPNAQLIFHGNH